MMQVDVEDLIRVPFGVSMEKQRLPRYAWDNRDRGSDSFVIFQYTVRGEGRIAFAGREHPVPAGHAFVALVPEASRYYFPPEGGPEWAFSWINFYGDLALRLWGGLRDRVGPVVALAPAAAKMLEGMIAKASRGGARSWRDPYEASGEAYRFYMEVLRHARPSPGGRATDPLARALAYLRAHYQAPLRIKEVAGLAGMSREHFTRLFFRQAGVSPASFLRGVRLEAAARLLRTTELPVSEVAFRSGFTSATQLGVFFRRKHRLSATAYRERCRKQGGGEKD